MYGLPSFRDETTEYESFVSTSDRSRITVESAILTEPILLPDSLYSASAAVGAITPPFLIVILFEDELTEYSTTCSG